MFDVKELRTVDAMEHWPTRGPTPDAGAGSRARLLLGCVDGNDDVVRRIREAYSNVVAALVELSVVEQAAVCASVGSQFTLDSLLEKSEAPRWTGEPTLTDVQQRMVDRHREVYGDQRADEMAATFLDYKRNVRANRKPKTQSEPVAAEAA